MSQAIYPREPNGLARQNPAPGEAVNPGVDGGRDHRSRLEIGGWNKALNDELFESYVNKTELPKFTIFKFFHADGGGKETPEGFEAVTRALQTVDPGMTFRIVFIENVNKKAVETAGSACGLRSGDWRMATRWLSVPERASFGANGMFIEVKSIWKTMPPETFSSAVGHNPSPHDGPALLDNEFGKWARRKIGVLFSKQGGIWTFIVLVAPETEGLEFDGKGRKVTRPEKGFLHLRVDENADDRIANTHWRNGRLAYCKDAQNRVEDMINYIAAQLKRQGPKFLEWIARDMFWGWGEFLKQMRLTILQIREASESQVHQYKNQHCWKLFRHRLILQETELLSRAYKSLEKAQEAGIQLPFNLKDLEPCRDKIQSEVKEDERLIKDAIDMIHNDITFEKAEHSAKSSNNMEYLSVLAAIFLPLSLFAGIFGMNIRELGVGANPSDPNDPKAPHWWVFLYVSVSSTLALAAVMYGLFWWKRTQATRKTRDHETGRKMRSLC